MQIGLTPAIPSGMGFSSNSRIPVTEETLKIHQEAMEYRDKLIACQQELEKARAAEDESLKSQKQKYNDYQAAGHFGNAAMMGVGATILATSKSTLMSLFPTVSGSVIPAAVSSFLMGPILGAGLIAYPVYQFYKSTIGQVRDANKS